MNRHTTSVSQQPASGIRNPRFGIPRSPFCIPHSAFCIIALAAFAASAATPVLTFKVADGYSMNLELNRPNTPNAVWTKVTARPCINGKTLAWGRVTDFYFNASLEEATFATMDDLYRWQQYYAKRDFKNPERTPLDIWFFPDGDFWRPPRRPASRPRS